MNNATLPVAEVLEYAARRGFDMSKTTVEPVVINDRAISGIFEAGELVATLTRRRDGKFLYGDISVYTSWKKA